jgi:hypothetical protein
MADVIDFPARAVEPDHLPEPGNRYQAYAQWQQSQRPMLTLVFSTWAMKALRYDGLERQEFQSLGGDGNRDGESVIRLIFGGLSGGVLIVINGCNLYRLFFDLSEHRVFWLWELPEGRAAIGDDEPAIRTITIRGITAREEAADLGDAEDAGFNTAFVPSV